MSFFQKFKDSIKSSFLMRGYFLRQELLLRKIKELDAKIHPDNQNLERELLIRKIKVIDHQIAMSHVQEREHQITQRESDFEKKEKHFEKRMGELTALDEELRLREVQAASLKEKHNTAFEEQSRHLDERLRIISQLEKRTQSLLDRFINPTIIGIEASQVPEHREEILKLVEFYQGAHSSKLCFFAHFDIHGVVDPWLFDYLEQIKKNGFDIIFISTAPHLSEVAVQSLAEYCRAVIHKENDGLDFGSWRCAYGWLGPQLQSYDQLLLVNDSVFGPRDNLDHLFSRIEESSADLIGLTDSWEIQYHLQSYFLYFKSRLFKSDALHQFWSQVSSVKDKQAIIDHFELGLTRFIMTHGFQVEALYDFYQVRDRWVTSDITAQEYIENYQKSPLVGVNPTIDMWEVLLRDFNFPFLKAELLKSNPRKSEKILFWRKYFKSNEMLLRKIDGYLRRTRNGSLGI